MNKKIIFILFLFLSFCKINAAELKDIDLIWQESNLGSISYVEKYEDNYYVYTGGGIVRYKDQAKKISKSFEVGSDYVYKIDGDSIHLIIHEENSVNFKIVDRDFKELNSINFENIYRVLYYQIVSDGYELIGRSNENTGLEYIKIDKNFKIINTDSITTDSYPFLEGTKNGKIYFSTDRPIHYYVYDNGFREITSTEYSSVDKDFYYLERDTINNKPTDDISKDLYDRILEKYTPSKEDNFKDAQIIKDGENYIVLFTESNSQSSSGETNINHEFRLVYFDKDLNEKWSKVYPEFDTGYNDCSRPQEKTLINITNGNILLLSNAREKQIFHVYDRNGKLTNDFSSLISIDSTLLPAYVDLTSDSLFLAYTYSFIPCFTSQNIENNKILPTYLANSNVLPEETNSHIYYFSAKYNINIVVKGKGNINVNQNSANRSDEVTFTIEPEEGYVLSEVRVTDANGNIITFKDYTFTMPSSDVTIEAVFVLAATTEEPEPQNEEETEDNPETGVRGLEIASIVFLISLFLVFFYNHKILKIK